MKWTAGCVLIGFLLAGCEDDGSSKSQAPGDTNAAAPVKLVSETDPLGVWKGPAGTAQDEATLILNAHDVSESFGTIDGKVVWANGDTRWVKNARYDSTAPHLSFSLVDENDAQSDITDTWDLTIDGATLSGTGEKWSNGDTYDVFMTRQD